MSDLKTMSLLGFSSRGACPTYNTVKYLHQQPKGKRPLIQSFCACGDSYACKYQTKNDIKKENIQLSCSSIYGTQRNATNVRFNISQHFFSTERKKEEEETKEDYYLADINRSLDVIKLFWIFTVYCLFGNSNQYRDFLSFCVVMKVVYSI